MRKIHPSCLIVQVLSLSVVLMFAGCGEGGPDDAPDLGQVSGTVKLDGQPLAGANIVFSPTESGSPSTGVTDSSGNYTLQYIRTPGAMIGKHQVSITTHQEADPDEGKEAVPEKVPTIYNVKATENPDMTRDVAAGSNTINFDLSTEGEGVEVVQPMSEEGIDDSCT